MTLYYAVLTPAEILASDAVAMSLAATVFSGLFWLMPFFVACSTLGTLNNGIMSSSRGQERRITKHVQGWKLDL
jgi:L-type amino acid transporter 5